jgi:transcriptional regulator with XRE-family HTH domain
MLRATRRKEGITIAEVVRAADWSRQRVAQVESAHRPTDYAAGRFLDGLKAALDARTQAVMHELALR